jgi:hypothetical protein
MLSIALRSMAALKASPFPSQPNDVEWADIQDASLLWGSYLQIASIGKSPEALGAFIPLNLTPSSFQADQNTSENAGHVTSMQPHHKSTQQKAAP